MSLKKQFQPTACIRFATARLPLNLERIEELKVKQVGEGVRLNELKLRALRLTLRSNLTFDADSFFELALAICAVAPWHRPEKTAGQFGR